MDEQRLQAYVGLIEQLLICTQGQEEELLQANTKLLDAGLLDIMEQYATHLESQGNSNAGWLRGFAAQLEQALGLEIVESARTGDAVQFLREMLRLVMASRGNPQIVYSVWIQQQSQLNPALLEALPQVVAQLFAEKIGQQVFVAAAALVVFGSLIQQFPLGTPWLNLELSIAAYEQALQVFTREAFPEQWAATQNDLATAYKNRIRGERADNLERAIATFEQALQVYTREAFPEQWAATQNNLANAYRDRIRGERADNLERAIFAYTQALQVRTRGAFPEQWAMTQDNLAIAYSNRIRGERADNLERAIAAFEAALQVYTREAFPEQWAETQNNLANAYWERIRGERADNLERAIAAFEAALQVYTREAFPQKWAAMQDNLANAYSKRIRGERADNLERAIAAFEAALQVRTIEASPEQWSWTQNNLAVTYWERIRGERADNLERAIAALEAALQILTHEAFPQKWAGTQNNLANAYRERIRGERADNLERAIAAFEAALQVYTREAFPEDWARTQNNLALAYFVRIRGERADNLEHAINAYNLALQVYTRGAFPKECRMTSHNLGNLHFEQRRWEAATVAYTNALAAAEILYQSCIFLDSKAAEVSETADLLRRTAYTLARIGSFQKVVEVLEQGHARGLSESLDRDRTNLENLEDNNLYNQYKGINYQLRNLEAQQRDRMVSSDRHSITPEALRNTATSLRQQLISTIDQIRQQPGYETFLTLPTFEDVQKAAIPECPLIYLFTTLAGSLALIVTPNTTDYLWLDDFTGTHLTDLLQTWFAAYDNAQQDCQAWYDTIEETTQKLWEPLMGPLVQKLQELGCGRITLIPTGYLSLLPLHAAWTKDDRHPTKRRYALDDIHFTYAPNAKSLTAAKSVADHAQANSILAIDDPSQDLPNSEREVQSAIASFPRRTVLRHTAATVKAVKAKLPTAAITHFSCHGTANLREPLNSGLLMSDGLLTLRDILALNLADSGGLRLAVLSACETGMIGTENAEEATSLPTGLLQAGVAAVIASLWSVSDLSTMLLLTRFYDCWRIEGLEMNQALNHAQQWLRDTTNREKAVYFKALLTEPAGVKAPVAIAQFLYQSLILRRPTERDFAHPFHWAAFSYTGV